MRVCIFGDPKFVHIQRIVPGVVARGVDVHIVCHNPVDVPGATVERWAVPPPSITNLRRWHGRWRQHLIGYMKRFDIVHVHFLHDWGFAPEIMDRGCFVASPWGSDIVPAPTDPATSPELRRNRIDMLRCAKIVTSWGHTFAGEIADYADIQAADIAVLPLGVDTKLFRPFGARNSTQKNGYQVGYFKGFYPVYGPTYLMRAIPTVVEAIPDTRFVMLGDGPQKSECRRLAGLYDVAHAIHWVDRQPHRNLPNHMADWDLSVIPSLRESFGAAALECSAMEVPVVASDIGGLPETVRDGETGLLVPPAAPEQLADAVIRLLKDEPTRKEMGTAGRAMVCREYEWEGILDRWVDAYERALDTASVMV